MSYQQVLMRTRQENVLFSVLLELTYSCNLDCYFCYNDTALEGSQLRLQDYIQLLDDLHQLGTMNIVLSGGEPLAHPNFMAIGRHAREKGFVVRIKSNGHALDESRARRIRQEIDPFVIDLSLHGATPETHDRQTRVPGSFNRLLKNIKTMQGLGFRLWLNSTLTTWNEHEIDDMYDLADNLGIVINIDDQVTGKDNGDQSPLGITASMGAQRHLLAVKKKRLQAAQKASNGDAIGSESTPKQSSGKGQKLCSAGSSSLLIDPFGTVYPCVNWRRAVGNIHEQSIGDIWQQSLGLAQVRNEQIKVRNVLDRRGDLAQQIPFCPGIAERETGIASKRYEAVERSLAIRLVDGDHTEA